MPKKYVEQVGVDGFKKAPVGAGPYKFVSFTPGVELVLEAFDQYWRKTPSVNRLVFKSIPEETTFYHHRWAHGGDTRRTISHVIVGVRFVVPPRNEPYGRVAVFLDLEGNRWDLLGDNPRRPVSA